MIADLVILGLAIKVIVGAVRRGRQRQPHGAGGTQPTGQIRRYGLAVDLSRRTALEPGKR
jgi:hypothetical protein